ncbi:MAG: LacI family DNA-binding transcriptional regulator [Eubacterium sp.]|nr:LacI family DNA-binding transcriptional regulator [Eubacterium sp.]
MKKKVTLQMVADYAGVSRGTVDRVINNRAHVSQTVYQRVMEALEATGYVTSKDVYLHNMQHNAEIQEEKTEPAVIGVLLPNWTGYFETEVQRGLQKAREEFEPQQIRILIEKCESDLPQEAVQRLHRLQDAGAGGLAVCAADTPVLSDELRQLTERNIPVITFNSDLPDSGRKLFVGQDYYQSGRVAGELARICTAPDTRIAATVGNRAFYSHRSRLQGFLDRMKEAGRDGQIDVLETFNDYHLTYMNVKDYLTRHPETGLIYMANQSIAGCIQALQEMGLPQRPKILTHDYSMETKILLEEGSIDFTISQNIYQQGFLPISLLCDYIQGRQLPEEDIISPELSIITSQNL